MIEQTQKLSMVTSNIFFEYTAKNLEEKLICRQIIENTDGIGPMYAKKFRERGYNGPVDAAFESCYILSKKADVTPDFAESIILFARKKLGWSYV